MHRVSEIIGRPLLSAETGDRLGRVSDALVAEGGVKIVAIVLGDGVIGHERVIPFHEILTLGGDTVLVRTESRLQDPDEWRQGEPRATRSSALRGRPVVSVDGKRVGEVTDLLINDETGSFDGVEVTVRRLAGFRTKRTILSVTDEMWIGSDAVIVADGALAGAKSP